jgi:hypothetical protein
MRKRILLALLLPLVAGAEEASEVLSGTSEATGAAVSARAISAAMDLRPSFAMEKQAFHSENELAVRYAFTGNFSLAYVQEFHTNLSNPTTNGIDFRLADGYLRSDIETMWNDRRRDFTLSYQARLYFPTARDVRSAGFNTELRNAFRLGWKFARGWEVALKEIPVVPVYSKAASVVDGDLTANPWFENRMELEVTIPVMRDLNLKIPIIAQSFRNRDAAGAKFAGQWCHVLWVYPELVYSISERTGLGVGYYSANLIDGTGRGFRNGVPQLILQQSI